jgi:hypothetical protein
MSRNWGRKSGKEANLFKHFNATLFMKAAEALRLVDNYKAELETEDITRKFSLVRLKVCV